MDIQRKTLTLKNLGIDNHHEAIIYTHADCTICRAEGFEAQARIRVINGKNSIIATLNTIEDDILGLHEASLSKYAWKLLGAKEGDEITLAYTHPLKSLSSVRGKVYGKELKEREIDEIIKDIVSGHYSDIHISTFLAACASHTLSENEILSLTQSMVNSGQKLSWSHDRVVDKHCVGGLPGNRTTLIVVPIVTAFGLMMPKTSSRAITSPAGTADTMEVFAPVNLDIKKMQAVVEKEHGCIAWGGSVDLSPADDILIRVERVMELDSEGQLVASILSKKIAAGANHILIDMPIGDTAKIRDKVTADRVKNVLETICKALGVKIKIVFSDGSQPIGRGVGPCLEAFDVLAVLRNEADAPTDLREHALTLAGEILEFDPSVAPRKGLEIAREILQSGKAWKKFVAICEAQGGLRMPFKSKHTHVIKSAHSGIVSRIDNRRLAKLAKLAGAPADQAAGIVLHTPLYTSVSKDQPLFTVHAEHKSELAYALNSLDPEHEIVFVEKKV